ncbi:heme-binding protein Hmx1p [[Candida] railenensis]|uniref:Heme-binding protein Hmx1p n=1 Tax=[Candida] railenensis TaxID=45579 RepID=A0A9P0QNF5_9ASCO|nr:heme-binding protein Hmx1p [[Candida] railenensis]
MMPVQDNGATTKLNQHEIIPLANDVGALGNRINKDTREAHNKIDKKITLKLALALRDAKIYRQGLQSFYHVFVAIEKSLYKQFENTDGEWTDILKKIWKPEVARREKAEQDLLFYYDDDKSKFISPMLSEQIKFVEHIERVTTEKPYLLLAYMHVMYLALFAGGRIMRSSISKASGLFPQKDGLKHEEIVKLGTNFFTFDVADENLLRIIYKRDYEILTRNNLTEQQKLEIIEESKYIFQQNNNCISEIERHNIKRLTQKWSYIAITKGYYVLMFALVILAIYYARRILLHLLY